MEISNFTREELANYILHTAKESVIVKFKSILENEDKEEIVAFTSKGEALTAMEYISHIQDISAKVKSGVKTNSPAKVKEYVLNRKERLGD